MNVVRRKAAVCCVSGKIRMHWNRYVMHMSVVTLVLGMLSGCVSRPPVYSFSPYAKKDGSKGMQDSYAETSEEEANKLLSLHLYEAGLCPDGWYIEKSWTAPNYDAVTMREVKCN